MLFRSKIWLSENCRQEDANGTCLVTSCLCGRGRMKRAFTLIELLVAVGILAMVLSFAGAIFRVSIDAHRTAMANSEIMQKFRAITEQLNSDFQGLRKDGEIFCAWVAKPTSQAGVFERFDTIMFFADGDFQSYHANPVVRGNVARICYSMAARGSVQSSSQDREKRILARTQHILTADEDLPNLFDPNAFSESDWFTWNNRYEYDKLSLAQWMDMPFVYKMDVLTVISGVRVGFAGGGSSGLSMAVRGVSVDPADPNSIHMLLCQGVGEFIVQGWWDQEQRWVPEVDPNDDGDTSDSDFYDLGPPTGPDYERQTPAVYYPRGFVGINDDDITTRSSEITEENFNNIPGLGRVLKFTFTLYDSKGIIEGGRTFTHMVYLDK